MTPPSRERRIHLLHRMRRVRLSLYSLITLAGAWGIVFPPTVLIDASEQITATIIASLWFLGGAFCLGSVLRHSVSGEFLWMRPLAFVVGAFAVALLTQIPERGPALGAYALLLLALGVSLWGWGHLVNGLIQPDRQGGPSWTQ